MRTYRSMGEAVANAMQSNIDLVFDGKCLAQRGTDICIELPQHDGPHRAWGTDNRWTDEDTEAKR